jgi:glycosyltransferase involved in cell wall biosynthesis
MFKANRTREFMTTPVVAVVLPTFNRLKYLRSAVASVFAPTLADWDLVIAVDGSGDGLLKSSEAFRRMAGVR